MKRGEIYHTREKLAERGNKPGYYVVVSRSFVAGNEDVSTVVVPRSTARFSASGVRLSSVLKTVSRESAPSGAIS
jgi:hypothetical protein